MKNRTLLFFFFVLLSPLLRAQSKSLGSNQRICAGDCADAVPLVVGTSGYYGVTPPPSGPGKLQEIKNHPAKLFEEEHNTAWYLLKIARDGQLVFDIVPQDSSNDYDFVLLKYTDSTFCDAFAAGRIKPVRSNLSNLSKSKSGVTGLSNTGKDSLIGKGPGNAYSNSIFVKKGERYMLVLDNVTPGGKGHTLFFNFVKAVELKGKITSAENVPMIADVTFSDNRGNTVAETKSNANGEYEIKTTMKESVDYSLSYIADESFVQTTTVNTKDLKGKTEFPPINTILPKLKKGEKYKLGNINFGGNCAILLNESLPSVEALYKLMKKNPSMCIKIEGHVNNPATKLTSAEERFDQQLSEARALTIYMMLVKKGISEKRMSTEGFAAKQMLYKHPSGEFQNQANRRVEIRVVSIN